MSVIRDIIYGAVQKGAELESLCIACSLSPETINESEQRLGWEDAQQVWALAVQQTADPWLGLHLGERTNPTIVGLVGHLMESSPDLKTAFENLSAFQQLVTEMFSYHVLNTEKEFILHFEPFEPWRQQYPDTARQAIDQAMAGSLHIMQLLSRRQIRPLRTEFVIPIPSVCDEYVRIFGSNIFFGQQANRLIFRKEESLLPLSGYHPELQRTFRQLLEQQKVELARQADFTARVKKLLLQNFDERLLPLPEVAKYLHISARSLQRRLREEGSSFQTVADEIRQELALELLKNKTFNVNEIAYRLGYAEASVFRKAFRKWTGSTPAAYRRKG